MIDYGLDAIFDTGIFAQEAIYKPTDGNRSTISVIFDNEYTYPQGAGIASVGSTSPMVTCRTEDVPNAARGDEISITVDGSVVDFKVMEVMPDGTGVTVMRLSRD